ncbi:unnamed protein product [Kluyveromyces dobzhanskii CBS 2104]|uniref:Phospholipase n=1 Tax=Kluyveromyces dobzhanskii CBS 2104 TaxID=1427455 RepID=A0A0A8LBA1_9SACH|nr:unnamed protein product [Kluyveromyces dobzhanskii CBS 2104]
MIQETDYRGQVIPGIKDEAEELSMRRKRDSSVGGSGAKGRNPENEQNETEYESIDGEAHQNVEGNAAENGRNSDFEASVKNLTFMGVPNSSVYESATEEDGQAGDANDAQDAGLSGSQGNKIFRLNYQDLFRKKDFGQAIKRLSKLTNASKGQSAGFGERQSSPGPPQDMDDHDVYMQNMASDFVDTMLAGAPAALIAGSIFMKDDNGITRAPMLLAMLSVSVKALPTSENSRPDIDRRVSTVSSIHSATSHPLDHFRNREKYHAKYVLHLEYGIGENRLKWEIIRSYKDVASLHNRLKLTSFQQNTVNKFYIDNNRYSQMYLPHFPRFDDHLKKKRDGMADKKTNNGGTFDAPADKDFTPRSSIQLSGERYQSRHLKPLFQDQDDSDKPMHFRIERYLKLLNVSLSLRPQANRLLQFYEMSPIGTLLSYENGYHGKQGYMLIRSTAKSQGWRVSHFKFNDFKAMIERHTTKWFLVRHSYITYVSDIYSTTPLDVFLVDSQFKISCSGYSIEDFEKKNFDPFKNNDGKSKISTKLLITLENSERKLQMIVKSEYLMKFWVKSILDMSKSTVWSQKHRFDSFAPVRKNCLCKFLVDGRDYFWSLSEALRMAKDVIYIHDWWLSPELYMRRPVQGNQNYRIDRILKEKAEQNVKIFIVVYRNVGSTVGTDSLWTKHSLLSLHENIHVIRSPNQWLQNTYFWAHHEKFCVIDNTVAFMGGIDLCYGRFDTPDHALHDENTELECQIFPGKDYSNARVCDFYDLDKPFESMYDRSMVPRMPWHDVHMMTVGEPARDLSRHFVQRWNYLLRQKRPSRPTPLLTPASDLTKEELERSYFFQELKDRSTCEIQIIRSAGNWSLGLKETEHSIQNAYLKLIETSNHYIYIENQFFVTSSSWDGVVIENKIGDAIVDRIVKANSEGKPWMAFIVIPLMPGFNAEVDETEGSSVRVIMQCQYQSISRGETSIFAKLKKLNIDPIQYIQFYSLRKWSTIGADEKLVTEQLYVHAKVMIVDDRSCIIGSANINERSMLGCRDSEVAGVVRDTELIKSKMNGEEYLAGRFPWELRQRLMREHLGCDVDLVEFIERKFEKLRLTAKLNLDTLNTLTGEYLEKAKDSTKCENSMVELAYREIFNEKCSAPWEKKYNDSVADYGIINQLQNATDSKDNLTESMSDVKPAPLPQRKQNKYVYVDGKSAYHSFNYRAGEANRGIRDKKNISSDSRLLNNSLHAKDVDGHGPDNWKNTDSKPGIYNDVSKQLNEWGEHILGKTPNKTDNDKFSTILPDRANVEEYLNSPEVECLNKWNLLKRVCYLQYLSFKKESDLYEVQKNGEVVMARQKSRNSQNDILSEGQLDDEMVDGILRQMLPPISAQNSNLSSLQYIDPYQFEDPLSPSFSQDLFFTIALRNTVIFRMVFHCQPDSSVQTWRDYKEFQTFYKDFDSYQDKAIQLERKKLGKEPAAQAPSRDAMDAISHAPSDSGSVFTTLEKGKPIGELSAGAVEVDSGDEESQVASSDERTNLDATDRHSDSHHSPKDNVFKMKMTSQLLYGTKDRMFDRQTARRLLNRIHGHLVVFPVDWLCKEVESNNWFYNVDRLPPIDIYD